jgi:hypothetical protein
LFFHFASFRRRLWARNWVMELDYFSGVWHMAGSQTGDLDIDSDSHKYAFSEYSDMLAYDENS